MQQKPLLCAAKVNKCVYASWAEELSAGLLAYLDEENKLLDVEQEGR